MEERMYICRAFCLGIQIFFLYDCIRIFRRVFRCGAGMCGFTDFCFWIFCGIKIFALLYLRNLLVIRWYTMMGAALGMILYRIFPGERYVRYTSKVLRRGLEAFAKYLNCIKYPLTHLFKLFRIDLSRERKSADGKKSGIRKKKTE